MLELEGTLCAKQSENRPPQEGRDSFHYDFSHHGGDCLLLPGCHFEFYTWLMGRL